MTFREYITQYLNHAKNDQIHKLSITLGLNELKLRKMMDSGVTARNINEYGRFDDLKSTVDKKRAKAYLEEREGTTIPAFKINMKIDNLLQEFIISGGLDM